VAAGHEQHSDDAEKLYREALAVEEPQSQQAAVTMELYGSLLNELGRADQSGDMNARARTILSRAPQLRRSPRPDMPPSVVQKIEPEYSMEGRAAKLQGTVVLQVVIGGDGIAHEARILEGLGLGPR